MSERLDRVGATKLPIPRSQSLVPHGLMNAIASRTCCKQAWPTVVMTSVTRWRVDPPVIGTDDSAPTGSGKPLEVRVPGKEGASTSSCGRVGHPAESESDSGIPHT
jgi:hypothetical protein